MSWGLQVEYQPAGLLALRRSEPGQVRKEAATAISLECRGWARLPQLHVRHTPQYLWLIRYLLANGGPALLVL